MNKDFAREKTAFSAMRFGSFHIPQPSTAFHSVAGYKSHETHKDKMPLK